LNFDPVDAAISQIFQIGREPFSVFKVKVSSATSLVSMFANHMTTFSPKARRILSAAFFSSWNSKYTAKECSAEYAPHLLLKIMLSAALLHPVF